ncbi:MAG: hypothetical protein ACXWV2_12800 [Chitinophagaceae bacterium]
MKNVLLLFTIFFYNLSFSQDGLYQFSKSYFRSNPFIGEFSSFLKHLINDPDIPDKKTQQRTDSTFFYFYGVYNTFNPFFFKPKRVDILLEETPVKYTDSLPPDTILVYQLIAYTDESKGKQEVQKEFEKIHRQYNKKFANSNYRDLKTGGEISGGLHNYFVPFAALAPASIVWSFLEETKEYILQITLRIKTSENRAVLPATFYDP